MSLLLTNCHLISPDQDFEGIAILIEGGLIRRIYAKGDALPSADEVIDVCDDAWGCSRVAKGDRL